MGRICVVVTSLLCIACFASCQATSDRDVSGEVPVAATDAATIFGNWRSADSRTLLHITPDQCITYRDGQQTITQVRQRDDGGFVRTMYFTELDMPGVLRLNEAAQLVIEFASPDEQAEVFSRLAAMPIELRIDPFALGTRDPGDAERQRIIEQLLARRVEDQAVRMEMEQLMTEARAAGELTSPHEQIEFMRSEPMMAITTRMRETDQANTKWLTALVSDVGWISAAAYSEEANNAAFLIVQHSGNLSLMRTVLPHLEAEGRANPSVGRLFALMYDRSKLAVGERQRYGTQITTGPSGQMQLAHLEDAGRLDEWRAEVGLGPISEYLALFEAAYGPITIVSD